MSTQEIPEATYLDRCEIQCGAQDEKLGIRCQRTAKKSRFCYKHQIGVETPLTFGVLPHEPGWKSCPRCYKEVQTSVENDDTNLD